MGRRRPGGGSGEHVEGSSRAKTHAGLRAESGATGPRGVLQPAGRIPAIGGGADGVERHGTRGSATQL